MTVMDFLLAAFLFIHFFDRYFYWRVVEKDWKRSSEEYRTVLMANQEQVKGLISSLEDYKAREKQFMEHLTKLKFENEELRKELKKPAAVVAN